MKEGVPFQHGSAAALCAASLGASELVKSSGEVRGQKGPDWPGAHPPFLLGSAASPPPGEEEGLPSDTSQISVCDAVWGAERPWMGFSLFLNERQTSVLKGCH